MDKALLSLMGGLLLGAIAAGSAVYLMSTPEQAPSLAHSDASANSKPIAAPKNDNSDKDAEIQRLTDEVKLLRSQNSTYGRKVARFESAENKRLEETKAANAAASSSSGLAPEATALLSVEDRTKAEGMVQSVLAAVQTKNGAEIAKLLMDLKNMGDGALPMLYKAYAAYEQLFLDAEGNRLGWQERNQLQETLGVDGLDDLVTGSLYTSILADTSGTVPQGLINQALWRLRGDPTKSTEERFEGLRSLVSTYQDNEDIVVSALWAMRGGPDDERSKIALDLLNSSTATERVRITAIEALPSNLDEATMQRLRDIEAGGDEELKLSARYSLQRAKPVQTGYLVRTITPDSQAQKLGMKKGDIIVSINGMEMKDGNAINRAKGTIADGQSAEILINRGGVIIAQQISKGSIGVDGGNVYREGEEPTQDGRGNWQRGR